jgi:UDPglucose 6-dehydrogenase
VSELPRELAGTIELCAGALEAAAGADALVVCTPWPDYREVPAAALLEALAQPLVVDPTGLLCGSLADHPRARHIWVGKPSSAAGTAGEPVASRPKAREAVG